MERIKAVFFFDWRRPPWLNGMKEFSAKVHRLYVRDFREPENENGWHAGNEKGLEYRRVPESEQSDRRIVTRPDGWRCLRRALSAAAPIGLQLATRIERSGAQGKSYCPPPTTDCWLIHSRSNVSRGQKSQDSWPPTFATIAQTGSWSIFLGRREDIRYCQTLGADPSQQQNSLGQLKWHRESVHSEWLVAVVSSFPQLERNESAGEGGQCPLRHPRKAHTHIYGPKTFLFISTEKKKKIYLTIASL